MDIFCNKIHSSQLREISPVRALDTGLGMYIYVDMFRIRTLCLIVINYKPVFLIRAH